MALAQVSDVEDRLGRELTPEETTQAAVLLDDAEEILLARIPDLYARSHRIVVLVEAKMVLRVIRNPDGYTQEADGNYSYSVRGDVASGNLDVMADEWSLLGASGGVAVISLTTPTPWNRQLYEPDPWVEI